MSSFLNFGTGLAVAEGAISLLFQKRKVRIGEFVSEDFLPLGAIELDASLEELHSASSDIVRHPIERGSDVTDHVRNKPVTLRLKGIVTNHPVLLGAALGPLRGISFTRAEEFYQTLLTIKNSATFISIITTLRHYENMLIKNFDVPRNKDKGNVVEATIFFEEVLIVDTEIIVAIPTDVANGGVANAGKVAPPSAASAATASQSQSALSAGAGKVGKFFGF